MENQIVDSVEALMAKIDRGQEGTGNFCNVFAGAGRQNFYGGGARGEQRAAPARQNGGRGNGHGHRGRQGHQKPLRGGVYLQRV